MAEVKFTTNPRDVAIIRKIAKRAVALARKNEVKLSLLTITMDVSACHANGCPLRLADFLAADDFNFSHDIVGIHRHIDRDTGKLTNCFLPRFSRPVRTADAA